MNRLYLFLWIGAIYLSCSISPDTELTQSTPDPEEEKEISPPVLLDSRYDEQGNYRLYFNEEIHLIEETAVIEPEQDSWELGTEGRELVLLWENIPEEAEEYRLSLTVEDLDGNSNWFIIPFWTPQQDQASLLINETNPKGSGNNPDCIEFYCTRGGTLKGISFYLGCCRENNGSYLFPEMEVQEGDYLILHCSPKGTEDECTEITDKTLSGGLLSSEEAWDFWCPEKLSLPGTSALFTLYTLPQDGKIMDCLVYTNREYLEDDEKLGWTSSIYDQLVKLEPGAWISEGDIIIPSEALWGDNSTATRSLCRSSLSEDSDRAEDWHTVPTSSKSFGVVNTDECYEP